MKIGAFANALRKPIEEALCELAGYGVQGVQIGVNCEFASKTDSELAKIREIAESCGIAVSAVCGDLGGHAFQIEKEHMKRAEFLCRVVDVARKLGTNVVTTHIGVVPTDTDDPVYPLMVRSIRHAAEYGAEHGVTFAIETGPEQPETLLGFIEKVNSKGLGVNLDPANLRMVSCVDPVHAVEVLGKYIVHTHAKDGINLYPGSAAAMYGMANPDGTARKFTERPAEFREVPLGEGQISWNDYLAALKKSGFNGFLTIERECGPDPSGDIRRAIGFLREKLAELA